MAEERLQEASSPTVHRPMKPLALLLPRVELRESAPADVIKAMACTFPEPRDTDVICGRGKGSYNHYGNRYMLQKIKSYLEAYKALATRKEKSVMLSSIRDEIISEGGRFVLKVAENEWKVIEPKEAKAKIGHAMREAMAPGRVRKRNLARKAQEISKQANSLPQLEVSADTDSDSRASKSPPRKFKRQRAVRRAFASQANGGHGIALLSAVASCLGQDSPPSLASGTSSEQHDRCTKEDRLTPVTDDRRTSIVLSTNESSPFSLTRKTLPTNNPWSQSKMSIFKQKKLPLASNR